MVHPQKAGETSRMRETMEMNPGCLQENGLSQILTLVLDELGLFYHRDVNGIGVLYSLLQAPWLQSLLKVHDCLHQYIRKRPMPVVPKVRTLSSEVVDVLREAPHSSDSRELRRLLRGPHFKALLSAHDIVAQKDFEPILPPLPDNIPENEEAMRIVCLVKNKQPLGATIKRHEITGDIIVARVIHGGLADRSGLLYAGDKLVEVNGVPVEGLEPEQVIQILVHSEGTIVFKLIPVGDRTVSSHTMLFVRAMADYWPQQDPAIPCADAGLPFKRGEILQIVDQSDSMWWQARKSSDLSRCAGLIPSNHLLKRKQREFWWSQPFMSQTCLKASQLSTIGEEEDMKIDEKFVEADEETFESEELKGEEEEFGYGSGYVIAGFRRSMRLCRRKSHNTHISCYSRCPNSCYHTVAAPYEEVVRYQRRPCDRHRLIILLGPSGVGVNELRKQLIRSNPSLFQSPVPHTTRPKKSYEEDGREYFFVSKEMFESMVYSHSFLEYGDYKGHMYGTSADTVKDVLDKGKICIIDLEQQGITGARTHELKPYVIFIKPPSRNCMRHTRRNASMITDYFVNMKFKEEDFQEIEESAKKMEAQFGQYFDQVLINDDLQSACVQLLSIVRRAQDEPQWIPASWICSDS
ncbi:MAGUK p55 subfamily member 4 [Aquarana catesbeiana]|uniref:MAGUK p55 subfamily member 4 n=1 Tax=Aquarana catesbeiana TaxID=8400 RepID=UPI003CC995F8